MTGCAELAAVAGLALALASLSPAVAAEVDPAVLEAEAQRIAVMERVKDTVLAIFPPTGRGGGSGVVITPDGYALTNFHVVKPCGHAMKCGMADGKVYDAVIVGVDPTGDIALVKLFGRDDFPYAELGDSDQVAVGDWCFAMGNPFLLATDLQPTVTYGIVSGVHRYQYPAGSILEYADCIQTDASINPGNSGGPLFDASGRLIGINGRGSFEKRGRVNVGVAYAVSINQIKNFLGSLHSGRIVDHATLGATVHTTEDGRVVVDQVLETSDAWRRGLRYGDEIIRFGGRPITTANAFKNVLGIYPKGWRVPLSFRHEGQRYDVLVRLEGVHTPEELIQKASGQPGEIPMPIPIPPPQPDQPPEGPTPHKPQPAEPPPEGPTPHKPQPAEPPPDHPQPDQPPPDHPQPDQPPPEAPAPQPGEPNPPQQDPQSEHPQPDQPASDQTPSDKPASGQPEPAQPGAEKPRSDQAQPGKAASAKPGRGQPRVEPLPDHPAPAPQPGRVPAPGAPGAERPLPIRPIEIGPRPAPAPVPEIVRKHYEEKRGYANYYFNLLHRERVWKAWMARARLDECRGTWTFSGRVPSGSEFECALADQEVVLTLPRMEWKWVPSEELAAALDPPQSGGLLLALYLWRRVAIEGPAAYGEVYYLGTAPLPGHDGLVDVLVAVDRGVESRLYFEPGQGDLLALEMFPADDVDPCELYFYDYREVQGRFLPGRLDVRHGGELFAQFNIEQWQVQPTASATPEPQPSSPPPGSSTSAQAAGGDSQSAGATRPEGAQPAGAGRDQGGPPSEQSP